MFFKTDGRQPLVVKEVSKLNDTIAQHHMPLINIRQFMPVIFSTDLTLSLLGRSELLVIMSKYDIDVNFQAIDSREKLFMERCVCAVLGHFTPWSLVDDL